MWWEAFLALSLVTLLDHMWRTVSTASPWRIPHPFLLPSPLMGKQNWTRSSLFQEIWEVTQTHRRRIRNHPREHSAETSVRLLEANPSLVLESVVANGWKVEARFLLSPSYHLHSPFCCYDIVSKQLNAIKQISLRSLLKVPLQIFVKPFLLMFF